MLHIRKRTPLACGPGVYVCVCEREIRYREGDRIFKIQKNFACYFRIGADDALCERLAFDGVKRGEFYDTIDNPAIG